jgi:hypothetical protein
MNKYKPLLKNVQQKACALLAFNTCQNCLTMAVADHMRRAIVVTDKGIKSKRIYEIRHSALVSRSGELGQILLVPVQS